MGQTFPMARLMPNSWLNVPHFRQELSFHNRVALVEGIFRVFVDFS
jgi:hypothetical protein